MNIVINKTKINKICSFISALMLSLYIFCAHFKYPFSSTYFLYIGLIFTIFVLLFYKNLILSKSIFIYAIIIIMMFVGEFYTNNEILGERQVTFFLVYFFFFLLSYQKSDFLFYVRKFMYFFALIGAISLFIQFIIPIPFNVFLRLFLRSDVYDAVMWSYNVDGTFTGITASVSMAAYSLAIVFFSSLRKILNSTFSNNKNIRLSVINKIFLYIVSFISLFGIILTSKRGIFVATLLALCFALIIDKNISLKKLKKRQIVFLFIVIIFVFGIMLYIVSTNDYVINFISRFTGNNITTGRDVFYEKAISNFLQSDFKNYLIGKGTASAYLINGTGLHNVFLQILYDHGIFGILIFLSFFVLNLKNAVKKRYFISISMQLVFLIYCMSGNPLYDYYFFIPYLIYVSCNE